MGTPACTKGEPLAAGEKNIPDHGMKSKTTLKETRMKIRIGEKTFAATLADNPTTSAFKALLPLTLKMSDLNGNEKFFHLPSPLPFDDVDPGTIQTGDLMLWSSKSVVLFYKTFPTSYSYTKLGRIDNPEGLSAGVGAGDVTIKFELE